MNRKVIELKGLKKSYGKFKALKGIDLTVEEGEIIGLLGPNGAGKTTTLKILTGLMKSDQGEIRIFGEKILINLPLWIKEKMGVVFEESNLYSRLTAVDNLNLFAGINGVSKERVDNLLEEYQLQDAAKKEVKNFSKGMKKRLMICRSLLAEPDILILDEATGGLDPISAEIIRKKVLSLKKEGKTVLLSTHYLEEADRLCDRIAFINQGQVIAVDKPAVFKDNLKEKYLVIKFLYNENTRFAQLRDLLEEIIKTGDSYKLDQNSFTLKLLIDEDVFKRAALAAEDFNLLEINKIEADLQEVFNKLNL